jgi:hypothetical protein
MKEYFRESNCGGERVYMLIRSESWQALWLAWCRRTSTKL